MLAFFLALQVHAPPPVWKAIDSTTVSWRAGAAVYQFLLEDSVVPTDSESSHRIRIRVPRRPDFTIVDHRGPGGFIAAREALGFADGRLIPSQLPDSARVLVLPVRGRRGTTVFALFGYAYASDPYQLILVGFDSTGYPRLLFRHDFDLQTVSDLDGDGATELIGRPALSERYGKCAATYVPFAVYRFAADRLQYSRILSRQYNQAHYVWAGPRASERITVEECTPGKYRLVHPK